MNLYVNIGAGYGRVVNQRPIAEAYAVADALGDSGKKVDMLPITSEKVWQWLNTNAE